MSTEVRFLLAIGLMLLVLVGTNLLFPPIPETPPVQPDTVGVVDTAPGSEGDAGADAGARDETGAGAGGEADEPLRVDELIPEETEETEEPAATAPESRVTVEGPLYRFEFSSLGARLLTAELPDFRNIRTDGPVQLLADPTEGALGHRLVVRNDTLDLRRFAFEVEPAEGLRLEEGGPAETLRFRGRGPGGVEIGIDYTFRPGSYLVEAEGRIEGLDRALVLTALGTGLSFSEADSAQEAGMMAWVGNHREEGIQAHNLQDVEEPAVHDGPFHWAAFKSKFFVVALLASGNPGADDYLGGVLVRPESPDDSRVDLTVAQNLGADGTFDYQLFLGPQEYGRLSALGSDLEEVNPYGWRFFRPIIRPFVSVIMTVLNFLHDRLDIGYGWVLILFGVLMRVMLWPLNQKAMRAQLRNMQVQPMLKEIQTKYKDQPEKLQKEMMRLYKEYGFNPLGGCWPMLLPWPILIALFFVFQNTVELRGVEFLWLPDLSAADPYYILPLFLALSMFALQFISYRSMGGDNPQMKMMMYFMPLFMGFIFMNFASGLNLYYATANIATIPQQFWIAKERVKAKEEGPVKRGEE